MRIRDATYHDLTRILEIECLSFAQPWSLSSFERELSLPFSRLLVSAVGADDAVVAGFLCRWTVADELHVLNIAVHPDCRRLGVAAGLIAEVVHEAKAHDIAVLTLEVRRSNLAARSLYRKFDFEERRLRRNYYGPAEDALVMELNLARPNQNGV